MNKYIKDFISIINMIEISENLCDELLNFIKPRPGIPVDAENVIVENKKKYYQNQIINLKIHPKAIKEFKSILEKNYYESLMQPGESVGIICGQCIGEKTTQSSLNNFHSAGLDTGSTSTIDNLQNIINVTKVKKKEEVRKYMKTTLFLKRKNNEFFTLQELKDKTIQFLNEILYSHLIINISYKNIDFKDILNHPNKFILDEINQHISLNKQCIKLELDLEKIFMYRITTKQFLQNINCKYKYCLPYSMLKTTDTTLSVYCFCETNIFNFIKNLRDTHIIGINGVNHFVYSKTDEGEWYIECVCSGLNIFLPYFDLYDLNRITCNSVHDMFSHFGILVAKQIIIEKCKEIIPEIDDTHFKTMALRMTKNGTMEPLTRYTMRNNASPLTKASFEESFRTFIEAGIYNETEKFKTISSAIVCGKKPMVGTYQCDILIDPSFYKF